MVVRGGGGSELSVTHRVFGKFMNYGICSSSAAQCDTPGVRHRAFVLQ